MADDIWWMKARLSRQEGFREQVIAHGPLSELIWAALEAEPDEQEAMTIEVEGIGRVYSCREWRALSERKDFPICI